MVFMLNDMEFIDLPLIITILQDLCSLRHTGLAYNCCTNVQVVLCRLDQTHIIHEGSKK